MRCCFWRLFYIFYTVDGPLPDESKLKRTIYEEISPWLHDKIAQTVEQVLKTLKLAAYADPLPLQCDRIHMANGTCFPDGTFTGEKEYCSNRLSVSYRADAPAPEHWLRCLSELLEPEDIPALQEYLGYCLIPSTKGQKMLMLIGKGSEGKSRISMVMNTIFGLNMNTTSIQKVENSRFARADLEGKLLMVDDDLDMNALTKTNYVKSIVTAELRMDLKRKKEQSYQGLLYVRFLRFGNGGIDCTSRPQRRFLSPPNHSDHQRQACGSVRCPVSCRETDCRKRGDLPLDAGRAAAADRQSLSLYHQPESQGQYLFRCSGCQ